MVFSPKLGVKILSSEYHMPAVKFITCLDFERKSSFFKTHFSLPDARESACQPKGDAETRPELGRRTGLAKIIIEKNLNL